MNDYSQAVYVFDLDGVITDPRDSSVDEAVVSRIGLMLEAGAHIAVNTGRSFTWVEQNLITRLQASAPSSRVFSRLYIVCEKGGESRVWQQDAFVSQPSRFALSQSTVMLVRRMYGEHKDELTTMFWDATKQTMATIEKYPEADLAEFTAQQARLASMLQEALKDRDVKVDPTTIATDVESPVAGKHAGAELIYEWVAKHAPVEHDTFTCFGDSVSDYEMARYFAQQGAVVTFVYVGKAGDEFNEEARVKLVRTEARYAAGTRAYLRHHL